MYIKINKTSWIISQLRLFSWDIHLKKRGYKCDDTKEKKLYISRDVTFVENEPDRKSVV